MVNAPEPGSNAQPHAAIVRESRALQITMAATVIGAAAGAILFRDGNANLAGGGNSVGVVAAAAGAVLGAGGFVYAYLRSPGFASSQGVGRLRLLRRILHTAALTANHIAIWLLLSLGLFVLLQAAFSGLAVDVLTAAILVGASAGGATYFMQASGSSITAVHVSSLLMIFISIGMFASMITTPLRSWWMTDLSTLGTSPGFSGFAFNFTAIVTGALIVTLSDYVTVDVRRWARLRSDYVARKVTLVGSGLAAEGVSLTLVGAFPVNRFLFLHNAAAISLVLIFLILVISLPSLLRGFPATLFVLGYAFGAAIVMVTVLYRPVGYYNLTALEIVAAGLILTWIAVFIRTSALLTTNGGGAPHR